MTVRAAFGRASRVLLAGGGVLVASAIATAGPAAAQDAPRADRVLVISYPRVTWRLIADVQPPVLVDLLARSAVASLSVQTAADRTNLADGYLTIGAGNRASTGRSSGDGFAVDADGGVLVEQADRLRRHNEGLLHGAETGALGQALTEGSGIAAVVANADVQDGTAVAPDRAAALAMMDASGRAGGSVSLELSALDQAAPGGRVVDEQSVLRAFDEVWQPGAAVLVEMSDVERAEQAGDRADLEHALRRSDELLAGLLDRVDGDRDLAMVVAPAAPGDAAELTVFAMAGAGTGAGQARSATTRRAGYVTLPDVAPTILDALGLPIPDAMTGTPITVTSGDPVDASARADRDARSRFRERAVVPVTVAFLAVQAVVYGATALWFGRRRARPVLQVGMLAVLTLPSLTFLSGIFRYDQLGLAGYVAALVVVALVLALLVHVVLGRWVLVAPLTVVGAGWLLLAVDAARGGLLQLDTPFGYSPIVAARFSGMGNLGMALLMVWVIVLATGLWPRWPGVGVEPEPLPERAPSPLLWLAGGLFVASALVDGLPGAGADIGGVLALVPALGVCWLALAGHRITWRRLVALVVAGVVAVVGFAALDLTRADDDRTHLGRFAQRVLDGDAWTVLQRKASTNLHVVLHPLVLLTVAAATVAVVVVWRRSAPFAEVRGRVPGVSALLLGSAVGAVLGFGVNDSGIVVPGMMLAVLVPWLSHLAFAAVPPRTGAERSDVAVGAP